MSTNNLPSAYQELEYIESTGTQYIDTALEGKDGYTFETKVVFTGFPNSYSYLAGFGTTSTNRIYFTRVQQSGYYDGWTYNGANKLNITATTNVQYEYKSIMKNGEQKLYRDNVLIGSGSTSGTASYGNIWLFTSNYNGNNNGACACKMYYAKFTYNNAVVRDFVPCYRKSDNVIGMYDTVSGVFYTNAGTGTFIKGALTDLPIEYQEVEYIESSGTQYIDTNVSLSSSDTVKCKFEITAGTYSWADAIYGCSNGTAFFVLLMRSPTQARVGTSSNQASSTNYSLNTIYDTSLTNGTYIENGTTYTFTPHTGFTNLPSCYVMFRNQSGEPVPVSAKVYSFEIVGKFNGIPCYRKADNEIGMFDTVNGVFYTNAGSGTFLKGSDITSEYPVHKVVAKLIKYNSQTGTNIVKRVKTNIIKNQTTYRKSINLIKVS